MARTVLALRDLSPELSRSGVAGLMGCVLEQFLVLEAATGSPRHRETWRRLRFVVDQARAWGTATHGSLRDYLRWAETQMEEGARVKEAVVPETDAKAVRITTVHAAKGLEYPVVILAGTGSTPRSGTHHVLFAEDGAMEVSLKKGLTTARHQELADVRSSGNAFPEDRRLHLGRRRAPVPSFRPDGRGRGTVRSPGHSSPSA